MIIFGVRGGDMSRRKMSKHHRIPRSNPQSSEENWNISFVNVKKHEAWHTLFQNASAKSIARQINKVWIDPRFELVVKRKASVHK